MWRLNCECVADWPLRHIASCLAFRSAACTLTKHGPGNRTARHADGLRGLRKCQAAIDDENRAPVRYPAISGCNVRRQMSRLPPHRNGIPVTADLPPDLGIVATGLIQDLHLGSIMDWLAPTRGGGCPNKP